MHRIGKKRAKVVLGIDFTGSIIRVAEQNATRAGVENRCVFVCDDFMTGLIKDKFDSAIVMGFMDYIEDPRSIIEKVLSITSSKAFFSFPTDRGILSWQRKLRYRRRCDLYMYSSERIEELFKGLAYEKMTVEKIARDFFVLISV